MRRTLFLLCAWTSAWACKNAENGAAVASLPEVDPGTREAVVFFTSELLGQVEPCGCRSRPLGGIQRIAAVVDRPGAAWIDAGDLLMPATVEPPEALQHAAKARQLARIFRLSGGIALNLGPTDVKRGGAFLRTLQQEGALPLVSANIRPVGAGGPSVARSLVRKVGDVRIGITGLAAPESLDVQRDLAALEFAPVLASEIDALKEDDVDVVVVLAHLERIHAARLASTISGIDVILHGSRPEDGWGEPSPTTQLGRTIVVDGGFHGRYVGRLRFTLPAQVPGEPLRLRDPDRLRRLEARVATYRVELERLREQGAGRDITGPRESRLRQAEARLRRMRSEAGEPPWVEVTRIPIERDLPSHPEVEEILASYHAELARLNWTAGDPADCRVEDGQSSYVGSAACADCHPEADAFWKKTPHAHAWNTLVELDKQSDLTCIGCHSVGYRQPGGFCRLSDLGRLRDVGCESCHGPGSSHIVTGDPSLIGRGLGEQTCAGRCHVPEHSDQFHYGTYLQVVTGEGHPLTASRP